MVRRKVTTQSQNLGSAQTVDPYEIPDDDPVPAKRVRRSLNQSREEDKTIHNGEAESQTEDVQDEDDGDVAPTEVAEPTPTKKRRGRPPRDDKTSTPTAVRQRKAIETPLKFKGLNGSGTPSGRNIADRSARRKSARALIDRVVDGVISDDGEDEEGIAREIYESSDDDDEAEEADDVAQQEDQGSADDGEEEAPAAVTPSKRRGRPPGSGRKKQKQRSPTPPQNLPPHEQYFYHNKPGRAKTSNNNLSSLDLLTHDEYFSLLRQHKDPHATNVQFLESLHAESFPQWYFELYQGFTTCFYGYGSKRRLLHQFARYIATRQATTTTNKTQTPTRIVIINGYVRTTPTREILSTIASAIDPSHRLPAGNPVSMVQNILTLLNTPEHTPTTLTLLINSIDAPPLRKPSAQLTLAQLAAHPRINLVCSADTPDFPLLWDSGLRSSFNFVFHDCTTFAPFGPEMDVVDEVHELLGRMARRVGGKEGVTFVLRSLPENAKSLFRLLVTEVLVVMDDGGGGGNAESPGIEYRMLYNKAVEEFICSSEMAFRTLLKEFHDHQIVESHKDSIGTELLSLPFRKDELEAILEDLMS